MICPCCGHSMPDPVLEELEDVPLSPVRRTIIRALARAYPENVPADVLIGRVYGASRPAHARRALYVHIHTLRHILRAYGWTIPRVPHRPGSGGEVVYRLEPIGRAGGK